MTSLLDHPLWRAEDLGKPIPASDHAVSVAMPLWAHVVGYEEKDPEIVNRLACGYPRFIYHPRVVELAKLCEERFAGPGEFCLPLPSRRAAEAARAHAGSRARVEALGRLGIYVLVAPVDARDRAMAYWQHVGRIVSSRLAVAALGHGPADDKMDLTAKANLKARLAGIYGVGAEHVYLFPTGMAAVAFAQDLASARAPGRGSVQYGFPYVDVLKVQEVFGPDTQFYPTQGAASMAALANHLSATAISAIVTETPGNPLLETPDIPALAELAHNADALLIVDDTVATGLNIDVKPWADLIATSLTKNFSGQGDVMGGALIISPELARASELIERATADFEDLLWWEDAQVLDARSRDFSVRMTAINRNAEAFARFLAAHPGVEAVYYPGLEPDPNYVAIARPESGYGGLLSFLPVDSATRSAEIYDRLRINKGPSLGTNYTLCCPYTILAHYGELDWAESCGVSRWLIRVSVGLEDIEDLKQRFAEVLGPNDG